MINTDSSEKDIKEIDDETIRLKSSQPFFYGQLNMRKLVSNTYTITLGSSNTRIGVTFTANTQNNPFCQFYVTAGIGGNFERHDVLTIAPYTTGNIMTSSGKTVSGYYYIGYDYSVNGSVVDIKAYAVASDDGTLTVGGA